MLNTDNTFQGEQSAQNLPQKNHGLDSSALNAATIKEWIELITRLQSCGLSFVVYRLPKASQVHMLLCREVEQFKSWDELGQHSGFLLAPFNLHSDHPIVLISPEFYFCGIEQAIAGLKDILRGKSLPKAPVFTLPQWARLNLEQQKKSYQQSFDKIQAGLSQGCRKLVLARASVVDCPEHNNIAECFLKACRMYPNMMVTLSFTPLSGTWLGSTPETLLKGANANSPELNDNFWHTMSLAGTMANEPDLVPVERWSSKNRHEQNIVTEFLTQQLQPWASTLTLNGPHCVRAGHLLHLRTEVEFSLKNKRQLPQVLDSIHPTPAVCGMPKTQAYEIIRQAESYDRSYYAGAIGLYNVDSYFISDTTPNEGKTEDDSEGKSEYNSEKNSESYSHYQHTKLFVNLRCMQFFGSEQAICYAGGGILPESDVASEFEETQNKMQTMQRLFETPLGFD